MAFVFSRVGTPDIAADPMPPNAADTYVILKPQEEWPDPSLTKAELIERMEPELQKLVGTSFSFSQPIQMRFNELIAGVREDIAVKIFGDEFEPMLKSANEVAGVLRGIHGAQDVRVEQVTGLPFVEIGIDKKEISRRGLSIAAVQDVIGTAIGGREAGLVFEGDRRFQIVVRLPDALRANADVISGLPVPLPGEGGAPSRMTIPLRDVASLTFTEGPNQVSRENGKRRVVVTANVRGRDIGSVVREAQEKISQGVKLPSGYWITWGGQFENLASARERLTIVVPACFVMIFLILFAALGSARDALLVFSAVPLALSGGIVALWLRGMPFSVSAAVGFIALSGVAVLNGLVMLTFIKQLIERGHASAGGDHRGRGHEVETGCHDGAGGIRRLHPDGAGDRHGRGSSEAAGDRRDRRADHGDVPDPVCAAGALLAGRRGREKRGAGETRRFRDGCRTWRAPRR